MKRILLTSLAAGAIMLGTSSPSPAQMTSSYAYADCRSVSETMIHDAFEFIEGPGVTGASAQVFPGSDCDGSGSGIAEVFSGFGLGGVETNAFTLAGQELNLVSATGTATWEDTITVNGGLGTGSMTIEVWVSGTLTAKGDDGGAHFWCEVLKDDEEVAYVFREIFANGGTVDQGYNEVCGGVIEFEYGTPFVLAGDLTVNTFVPPVASVFEAHSGEATSDFSHTARLAVFDLPPGASAVTASGTTYPIPAPEPAQALLLAIASLGLAARLAWERRA